MKRTKKALSGFIALSMAISVAAPAELISLSDVLTVKAADQAGQKFTVGNGQNQHKADNVDGYSYEIWLDNTGGSGSMTLGSGGTFSTEWSAQVSSGNFLARRGRNYDASKKATEYGPIVMDYAADYSASSQGNSRLCVYGWMKNPLVEYYIIEDWVNWCPKPNGASKTVTIDGAEYEIFQLDHTGPTILGTNETFKQYFSVRKSKRTSGTITVSDHFKAWADAGWNIGNLTEVALNVEGWESSGKANVTKLTIGTGSGEQQQTTQNPQQGQQQNPGQNPEQNTQQNPWGGQNPVASQDPNQQNPWGGQMPWGDQNPVAAQDPNQQNPWGGQMPWGDQNPNGGGDPNQQNPWGGQTPWGDQNPNGGQAPQGQQNPVQNATADFTFGDINDDTKIDITDLSLLAVHLIDKTNFTEKQKLCADVAYNGNIELADLATLRQFISKVITKLGEGYTAPANQPSQSQQNPVEQPQTQQPQQNPWEGQMPWGGQNPNGGDPNQQNPWGGQMPWGDQNPNGGGDPNQQNPWGGQMPWGGDQNPNGGQAPQDQQPGQGSFTANGQKFSVGNGQNQHKNDNVDGYSYEIWLDNTGGSGSMTLGSGGTFSTEWSAQVSSGNFLARRGRNYDATKKATEYGPIVMDYAADYSASSQGNSRLCVYGWMKNPLVEYYIIEDWVNWCPSPNGASKTVTIDGAEYEIFQLDHTGPTILGTNETFKQYFSVRKSKRTSGTITVSDHFKAWAAAGWNIGNLTEVALNVEGWESSGKANVTKLTIGTGSGEQQQTTQNPQQGQQQNPGQNPWGGQNPNGGQNPGEQQVPQQTAKSTGSKGKVQNGVWTSDADISWIDPNKPMVAISFDDGPIANSQNPGRIHNALTKNGFHATFFYWGERIAGNEQEIKNAFNAGFEVANHTWTHPNLTGQGDKGKSEYQRCKQALDAIIGGDNDYLLRPPYLNFDSGVGQAVGVPCPNCGLDTKDWDGASKDQILNTLKSALANGSLRNKVVLCHENYDTTASAMEEFLPYLKSQGWQCVTVSEMFKAQGKTMQAGQLYNECR